MRRPSLPWPALPYGLLLGLCLCVTGWCRWHRSSRLLLDLFPATIQRGQPATQSPPLTQLNPFDPFTYLPPMPSIEEPFGNPFLSPLISCPRTANPVTSHHRLPARHLNISLTPPDLPRLPERHFNPTFLRLPSWAATSPAAKGAKYLLVTRKVTKGLHQESFICLADICLPASASSPLSPDTRTCTASDYSLLGQHGGLRCTTTPTRLDIPPTAALRCSAAHDCQFGLSDRAEVEKNWMLFFPGGGSSSDENDEGEIVVQYDLAPKYSFSSSSRGPPHIATRGRTLSLLHSNTGITTAANLTSPLQPTCFPPSSVLDSLGQRGHWHQSTNALKLILCTRSDLRSGACGPRRDWLSSGREVHFSIIHRKFSNSLDLPMRYERFAVVWEGRKPWRLLGVSQSPMLFGDEVAQPWTREENEIRNGNQANASIALTYAEQKHKRERVEKQNVNSTARVAQSDTSSAYFTYTPSIAWAWRPAADHFDADEPDEGVAHSEHDIAELERLGTGFLGDELLVGVGLDDIAQVVTRSESGSEQWTPDPSSAADFYGLFYLSEKPSGHSEEFKISNIRQQVIYTKGVALRDATILWVLRSSIANGDEHAACRFLVALSDASEGLIANYEPCIAIKGAANRHGVTCYLDATLFAMFSRLDSFEAMLYNSFPDRPRNKLSFLLRLWVNLIRTGQLVTTEVTALIQNALRDCGWSEAAELRQQDASEAFIFITGKLELPLLTLKMDIYHTGKEDASDDHKFVNERLLDVAIPEDPSGRHTEITLEDCLEEYFNNRVEVKRYLERRSTLASVKNEYGSTPSKSSPIHVEVAEIRSPSVSGTPTIPPYKGRAQSIIQERYIPFGDDDTFPSKLTSVDTHTTTYSRADSVRKEVVMPAWQFFSLIPWYTDNAPSNDAQVAAHFSSKRPMLGMCLKRYAFRDGRPVRLNTYVDIPVEIGLPHFIQDDQMTDDGALFGNFKLSLQAVVCHRGYSVNSGHYVALVRSNPDTAEMPQWVRFDDLAPERVAPIDIYAALREETPYLLFYQILPIDGDPGAIMLGQDGRSKSDTSLPMYKPSADPGLSLPSTSDKRPGFETTPTAPIPLPLSLPPPPPHLFADDDHSRDQDRGGSRRQSIISIVDPSDVTSSSNLAAYRNLSRGEAEGQIKTEKQIQVQV
ncbi:hypothetical protein DV735_g2628, partial [Chaetothyriales sp. CBS 134920]